ncbi:hypothetical protein Y032_0020g195 [Ancylostoma ceylanicum]|uniref:Uncharacterized protein n=1 Tax=Ancylostoma ceylanicum TaxID=53326 RepID=A0A016V089_9BILA|nr:hypothetical protein Y032_0020g195 [Ancylostoma ceylanicum]
MTKTTFLGGSKVQFTDHLGGAVRECAGCPPWQQRWPTSLEMLIDKINGFARQFDQANCYKPLTNPVAKNGFKDCFMTFYVCRRNQHVEEIRDLLTARTRKRGDTLPLSRHPAGPTPRNSLAAVARWRRGAVSGCLP